MTFIRLFAMAWLIALSVSSCSKIEVQSSDAVKQQRYSQAALTAAALSDSGKYALLADGSEVCLWNNELNKKAIPCISGPYAENIEIVGIAKNEHVFFTSNRIHLRLYRTSNGQMLNEWHSGQNIINDIAIASEGQLILLGYRSGQAALLKTTDSGMTLYEPHTLDVNAVALSDNGKLAFTGSSDKTARLWHSDSGQEIARFDHRTRVNHVDLNQEASIGFSLDSINDRRFWQLTKQTEQSEQSELQTNLKFLEINHSAFSSDSRLWLSGSPKQVIKMWRTADGELLGQWQSFKEETRFRSSVLSVAFVGDNQFATLTSDAMYELFDYQPAKTTQE